VDLASISGAIAAIRGTIDIAKGAIAARDQSKLEAVSRDMSEKMLDLLQTASALETERHAAVRRCAELEDENGKLKKVAQDLERYHLYRTRGGGLCLRANPGMPEGHLVVYLCANCANEGKKTYLQPIGRFNLQCPAGHPKIPSDEIDDGRGGYPIVDSAPYDMP
jgi:hypothetical protein